MSICDLCQKETTADAIDQQGLLETFKFLKQVENDVEKALLCSACMEKVKMVAGFRQHSKSTAKVTPQPLDVVKEVDTEELDVDLEELDLLSSYYAEQDDDPDFVPNVHQKKPKKISKPTKVSKVELKCQLCDAVFSRVIALRRHYLNDHEDIEKLEYKCKECNEVLEDKTALVNHFLKTHVVINQCKKCGKKFRLARSLRNHIANYCPQVSGHQKPCDVCDKLLPLNMIASHRAFSHVCPHCSELLPNRREKCRHLRDVHKVTKSLKNQAKTYSCKLCQQSFSSSHTLSEHLVSKHPDDTDLVASCPHVECKQKFPKGSIRLRSHLKKFHNNEPGASKVYKYECQICYGRFKNEEILKSHMQTKHGNDKIKCPYCSYVLPAKRKSDLYRHHFRVAHHELTINIIKAHDEKLRRWKADLASRAKIQCLMCSFAGVKTSNMARHYVDVHGYDASIADAPDADDEMPDGALCVECGQIFINRHGLMRHLIKTHSKPGGEQCLYCPFRYKDILAHIDKVHSDEKNATDQQNCKRCVPEQKFSNFQDLLQHMRNYHKKKIVETKKEKVKKLCENCGKLAKHKSNECPVAIKRANEEDAENEDTKKRYVPIHLSGTCPYCEYKFSDLLGHIRHGHEAEKNGDKANICPLCAETFGSVRELVSHRQLHPQFKNHSCSKCSSEFETVVELRHHRAKLCTKSKKVKKKASEQPESAMLLKTPEKTTSAALNTLMAMANNLNDDIKVEKVKNVDYEGRGSVPCHLCKKSFTLKVLLKRHYIACHGYDPKDEETKGGSPKTCELCQKVSNGQNEAIKHHFEVHAQLSGQICPYCDSRYGAKKFDDLDSHVAKYHGLEMQSPVQTCNTCKTNFDNYEALKIHRQVHEGGNRPRILVDVTSGEELISVHPRVGAKPEISNRGGLKCQLCNAFKLRKDHMKLHYIRHHGYDPKAVQPSSMADNEDSMQGAPELECPSCHAMFENQNFLIKHLLKNHCVYSGQICPYCPGHFPSRFIDLQTHVTNQHMDQLTGYNTCNRCKVCQKQFAGYAELRDHVQVHGDGYKDILPSTVQGGLKRNRKKSEVTKEVIIKRASTKILVPVAKDSNGQLRLSSDILQKAVLMATQGGQIENLPTSGLIIANDADATATERNVDNLTASFTIDSNNTELWQ